MYDSNGTKIALANSMKKLMAEKPFSKINISDICDGCKMNRKSFYYHFKDKYDLLNWIFYADFVAMIGTNQCENGWDLLEFVCEMFYKDQKFYRSAFKIEGQNSLREYLVESMLPIVDFMFEDKWGDIQFRDIIGKMFCETYVMGVTYWLDSGCTYPPKAFVGAIKELIRRLAKEDR